MARVNVKIKGIDSLILKLGAVKDLHLEETVKKATVLVHGTAKSEAPVDTGGLKGSIRMDIKKTPGKVEGRVYTNLEYAPYVEFGTGVKGDGTYPYKVKGLNLTYKDKGWCYFDEKQEKLIYTKGQVAQPFMYPAIEKNRKKIREITQSGVKESLKKACKGGK